jgi:hypothetical protein
MERWLLTRREMRSGSRILLTKASVGERFRRSAPLPFCSRSAPFKTSTCQDNLQNLKIVSVKRLGLKTIFKICGMQQTAHISYQHMMCQSVYEITSRLKIRRI